MCAAKIEWLSSARNEGKYLENLRELSVSGEDKSKKNGDVTTDSSIRSALWRKKFHDELLESAPDIDDQRRNPTSPLYSARTFEALNLKPELLKGIYDMGYSRPSKIQELALPTLFADPPQNLIAQAQSGTGKTAAFLLAMLNRVDTSKNYPQALCLSPTYELAIQIGEAAAKLAKYFPGIEIVYSVRGETMPRGSQLTQHVIIGTPGKTLDWSLKFKFFDLSKIKAFVLDEADVMIDIQGHQDQCIRMHRQLSSTCQMMFFSATYNEKVLDFAELIVNEPIIIKVKKEEQCLDSIKQYYVLSKSEEEKYTAITNIYSSITVGQSIFFCKTKKNVAALAAKLTSDGHVVGLLSSELTVEQRLLVLDRFRQGEMKVLVSTDVLSRGIDIPAVTMVVNYDLPVDVFSRDVAYETYLHRIGRTGRFGLPGIAINLVDSDEALAMCQQIEKHFNRAIKYLNTDNDEEVEAIGEK